ncbi:MAG: LytTR family DNA-binding domain-containing protein [Clostridium sp.]|nr:LytTR family DNA-binding domain-containing protein [Clostridium sp.]
MLKIAVCDDEEYFGKRIKDIILKYMQKLQYACNVDCFESGSTLIKSSVQKWDYDIVFLDVNMEEMDGIETAKAIRKLAPDTYIIFVTAYISYALEGYKVDAVRHLLKEDENLEKAMQECLDTVTEKMNYREMKCTFEFQGGKMDLAVDRILYVESRLHKVIFFVLDHGISEYYLYGRLDTVEDALSQFGFFRIHQSFLVNMKYVKHIERYRAVLLNGMEINISKKYYKNTEMQYIRSRGDI